MESVCVDGERVCGWRMYVWMENVCVWMENVCGWKVCVCVCGCWQCLLSCHLNQQLLYQCFEGKHKTSVFHNTRLEVNKALHLLTITTAPLLHNTNTHAHTQTYTHTYTLLRTHVQYS